MLAGMFDVKGEIILSKKSATPLSNANSKYDPVENRRSLFSR